MKYVHNDSIYLIVLGMSVLGMTLNCIHPYCLVCAPNGERLGPPLITVVASARACGVKRCCNKIHAGDEARECGASGWALEVWPTLLTGNAKGHLMHIGQKSQCGAGRS